MSFGDLPSLRDRLGVAVHAVVPAAGGGSRFGGDRPKQFRALAGRPLLRWTIERLLAGGVDSVTVALPAEMIERPPEWLAELGQVSFVAGGATRQASVALALSASPAQPDDLVLVHDGARPALAAADLREVAIVAAGAGVDGAVLGRPLFDTLKRIDGVRIVTTVERQLLFRAETPQVFRRQVLERAFAAAAEARFVGTDESSLVERLPGARVLAVEASQENPKVTTPADLARVEALLLGMADPEQIREWR